METKTKKFEVGKRYSMRSICDSECIWTYEVMKRSERSVVLMQVNKKGETFGEQARFLNNKEMTFYLNAECVRPLGSYSMAPILSAK